MSRPSRHEIEKFADDAFGVTRDRLLTEAAEKERIALGQVRLTGNCGGYLPALIKCKAESVREMILSKADAYVDAFTLHRVPSDPRAEKALQTSAQQMTGGSIAAVRGQLQLRSGRLRIPEEGRGMPWHLEIERSMQTALKEGVLRLRRQRITFKKSGNPLEPWNPSVSRVSEAEVRVSSTSATSSAGAAVGTMKDTPKGTWDKYRQWFVINRERLEAMVARANPMHLPVDEQDAARFSTSAAWARFDEIAQDKYQQWVKSGGSQELFSATLLELRAQVLTETAEVWNVGSDLLRQWYENSCKSRADSALTGRMMRWEHVARTTEMLRHLSRDRGVALAVFIENLDTLTVEEAKEVPSPHDTRRLRVWVHPISHHFEGGYSGDFAERVRLMIKNVGLRLHPQSEIPPLDFCLRMLLRELVCEREPLARREMSRLNSEQLGRYLWAPYSGNSVTPDSGQVLNVCEALKWYCRRLLGLLDLPDVHAHGAPASAKRRGRHPNQARRDAIHNAITKYSDQWRHNLGGIFTELDNQDVSLGKFENFKIDLGDGASTTVGKWDDLDFAEGEQRRQIIDVLRKYTD